MTRRRNLAACSPFMRKGGVHTLSKSGERSRKKQALKQAAREPAILKANPVNSNEQ